MCYSPHGLPRKSVQGTPGGFWASPKKDLLTKVRFKEGLFDGLFNGVLEWLEGGFVKFVGFLVRLLVGGVGFFSTRLED